jgi:hypothetical protein
VYCILYKYITYKLSNTEDDTVYKIIDEVKKDNNIIKISYGEQGIYLSKDNDLPLLVSNTDDVIQAKVLKYGNDGKDLLMIRKNGTISYLNIDSSFEDKVTIANNLADLKNIYMIYNISSGIKDNSYYSVLAKDNKGNVTDITEALIEINENI